MESTLTPYPSPALTANVNLRSGSASPSPPRNPTAVTHINNDHTAHTDINYSNDLVHSSDPYAYLSSITFHQSFLCPRTQSRVSYADCGNKEGPVIVYVLPSGCSRWVGIFHDGYARKMGVRLVAPDRPGQGATPRVKLESRIEVAHQQMLSLLEHIGVKKVSFMTHSAGMYFLLPVLASLLTSTSSSLPQISSRIFLSSAWVPTSVSGNFFLSLLPTPIVGNGYLFLQTLLPAVSSMAISGRIVNSGWKGMLGMSGFDVSTPTLSSVAGRKLREQSQRTIPTADIHPPFESQFNAKLKSAAMTQWVTENVPRSVGSEPAEDFGVNLLFDYMFAEGMWGMSQEQLLCLGRANDGGTAKLTERLVSGWEEVGKLWIERKKRLLGDEEHETIPDKLSVVLYWANGDALIPHKGRVWLENLLLLPPGLELVRHELGVTSGHDTPMDTKEVIEGIFGWVKMNGM